MSKPKKHLLRARAHKQRYQTILYHALLAAGSILISLASVCWAQSVKVDNPTKPVIAIGDIHGDFDDFVVILKRVGLLDAQQHWAGGETVMVQVGDLLDRGPRERDVLELLMSLEPEAHKAGGNIVVLLGNHEVMNILGDLRYVTSEEYASFTDNKSDTRRRGAYKQYVAWYRSHSDLIAQVPPGTFPEPIEPVWMFLHPLGLCEHRQAFASTGRYGSWLRKHTVVAKIGDTVFVHGGIHPRLSSMSLEMINSQVENEIDAFDSAKESLIKSGLILPFFSLDEIIAAARGQLKILRKSDGKEKSQLKDLSTILDMDGWLVVGPDGPLWFRGYAQWSEDEGIEVLRAVLRAYNAAHFVVGHTPQTNGRITCRFKGEVFMIDTGMLDSYYPFGRASALRIEDRTKFIAEYTDSHEVLLSRETGAKPRTPTVNTTTPTNLLQQSSQQDCPQTFGPL